MKRYIINTIAAVLRWISRFLIRCGIRPRVIIYMDGGICSQMFMYLNGRYYAERGLDVYYDTMWFVKNGKDMDGKFDRVLEFSLMYPEHEFKTLTPLQSKFYRHFFMSKQVDGFLPLPDTIDCITYLGGFYDMHKEDEEHLFETYCKTALSIQTKLNKVCAVHVRRGDLANRENQWYKKVPDDYFMKAIAYVSNKYPDVEYYFFSDEPDWVEKNICPLLSDAKYKIIRGNRAYEDLLLIAQCGVVIASQGSFGKIGAKLNGKSELILPSILPSL